MNTKQLSSFLEDFSGQIDAKNVELFKKIIAESEIEEFEDYESFYFAVIYPFENFVEGFVQSEISRDENVVFLMCNSSFVESHFEAIIRQKEGFTCCADKSSTIVRSLIRHYKTGNEIKFNYDAKVTYHLPKEVFCTHEQIVAFYEGLKALFYGSNEKYLAALAQICAPE